MKKIISLTMIFMLLLSGCTKITEPKVIPHTVDLPDHRPDDFAIYFNWGYSSLDFFDTYEGKIGKDLISNGGIESELEVEEETLDLIYTALRQYDIASIDFELTPQNCAAPGEVLGESTPCATYLIRFRVDGEEYEVRGNDDARPYECAIPFFSFVKYMEELARSTPEYQAFPEAEGGYL